MLTFSIATLAKGSGVVQSVVVIDDAGQEAQLDLLLFDQSFTATADNDAIAISTADAENCIGVVTVSAYSDMGTPSVGRSTNSGLAFKAKDDRTIYGQLVTRGTPTYASTSDLTIKIGILAD